jgi:Holliday junction resolvase RusA-like endonuclease
MFTVEGTPKVQKQTQWNRKRGYDPSSLDRKQIIWQISPYAPKEPLEGAIEMDVVFYMPMPKVSRIKTRAMINGSVYPIVRPDIDNMAYILTNAMKGIYYRDDSQIVDLSLRKRYAENPRTVVKVREI